MVDDVCLVIFIRAAVVVDTEVDVSSSILELLPGQRQGMTSAGTEKMGDGAQSCEYIQRRKSVFRDFIEKRAFFYGNRHLSKILERI